MNDKLRFEILRRDDFRCRYCGRGAPNAILHVDHVIARANGGGDEPSNLVTACKRCNLGKHTLDGRGVQQLVNDIEQIGYDLTCNEATWYRTWPYDTDMEPVPRLLHFLDMFHGYDPVLGYSSLPLPTYGHRVPDMVS